MRDPRPVVVLLLAQLVALALGGAWWVSLVPRDRLTRLQVIGFQEHVGTLPPGDVLAQPEWLVTHRLARLQGMVALASVALVIGVAEGILRRQTDVLGGFLLSWWTGGVILLALLPGGVVGYLVAPWPLPVVPVGWGMSAVVGVVGYGLALGRPYIP